VHVAIPNSSDAQELRVPVVTNLTSLQWVGAMHATGNTGELSAVYHTVDLV